MCIDINKENIDKNLYFIQKNENVKEHLNYEL